MNREPLQAAYEVIVVGAGAAGVAAAVAAARDGRKVALLEKYGFCGGQAVSAYVGTVCGLYPRGAGAAHTAGSFALEFADRLQAKDATEVQSHDRDLFFLPYQPQDFEAVCEDLLRDAGVDLILHCTVFDYECEETLTPLLEKKTIYRLSCLVGSAVYHLTAKSFVDATGEGLLSRNGAQLREELYQAPGYVWGVSNLDPAASALSEQALSRLLLQTMIEAEQQGRLTKGTSRSTVVPGSFFAQGVVLKLAYPMVRREGDLELTALEQFGRSAVRRAFACLVEDNSLCREARLSFVAAQAGLRSGPRAEGEYVLRGEDLRCGSKFPTVVARGLWPMERWDVGRKATLEYVAGNSFEIPAEALCALSFDNLFVAGRGISADEAALSAARVIGTSLSTGFGAGLLASYAAQARPRAEAIEYLQKTELRAETACTADRAE